VSINTVLSIVLLTVCLIGIFSYGALAPWYRSSLGWSIMGLFLSLALATGVLASAYVFGDYPYRREMFTAVFVILILVVGCIVANIIRYQLPRRRTTESKPITGGPE
jgi:hypothetical protein